MVRGLRTLRSDGARTCYMLRLWPSRGYVTCSGWLARSQVTCGAGECDGHQMLWIHNLGGMLRQKPETSSCDPGNLVTRGDLLELLHDRCSHCPLQGTSVILTGVFAWSFVAVSLRVEPRRRALSVGPPRGVTRHTQEVCRPPCRPPHRRGAGGLGASRGRAHDREPCSTPASCSKPQPPGKGPSNRPGGSPTSGDRCRQLGARDGYSERTDPRWRSGPVGFGRVESVPGSGHALEGG